MFGDLVRANRRRLGLTQEELADLAGLSVRAVGKLESGVVATPRPPTVRTLADAFGLAGADRERFFQAVDDTTDASQPPADGADNAPRPVPAQLPADLVAFCGRDEELTALSTTLTDRAGAGATMVISAIAGGGGIGKTWLAIHWAHQQIARFPDGQLFVNLRGFDPSGVPMTPTEALRGFLDALGVPAQAVPPDRAAQVGLYRSLMAGRRALVVLDNARDAAQVEDLLPGSGSCVVLVTSRDRMAALVRSHGAYPVPVDVLDDAQAYALLRHRLGPHRMDAEPEAVAKVIAACGGLPLALGIVAARAALSPYPALGAIAVELCDASTRLAVLNEDDSQSGLRAALSWSVDALSPADTRAFTLLGLVPGPDIDLAGCAALTGLTPAEAGATLRTLERRSLIGQPTPGRWRMHDLVRLYAAEQARIRLSPDECGTCLRRLVDFLLHTAYGIDRLLDPHRPPIDLAAPADGVEALPMPQETAAWAWLDREQACLQAAQRLAAERGWHDAVWQLAWVLDTLHRRRGHVHDRVAVWQAGLLAAERSEPLEIQALAHMHLGRAYVTADRPADGVAQMNRGLLLAEKAGDVPGQAHIYRALTWAVGMTADEDKSLEYAVKALELYRELDDAVQEADALNSVGWTLVELARYDEAREHLDAALRQARRLGHQRVETETLDSLGYLAHHTGDHAEALRRYRQALELAQVIGDTYSEAEFLEHLGETFAALGDTEQARHAWQESLRLLRRQHRTTNADRVHLSLDKLAPP